MMSVYTCLSYLYLSSYLLFCCIYPLCMYIYILIITLSLDLFITLQYLFIITLSDFIHVLINFFIDLSNVQALDLSESRAANDIVLSTGGDAGATFSSQEVSSLHALSRSGGMDWDGDLM